MAGESPFSGGIGKTTGNPQSQAAIDFTNFLTQLAAVAYIIDPAGLNIAIKFQGNGIALIHNNGVVTELPYTRVKI